MAYRSSAVSRDVRGRTPAVGAGECTEETVRWGAGVVGRVCETAVGVSVAPMVGKVCSCRVERAVSGVSGRGSAAGETAGTSMEDMGDGVLLDVGSVCVAGRVR
jgi:hypothetical protein